MAFFLYQGPSDMFVQRFSNDDKMICIDVSQGATERNTREITPAQWWRAED